jgi:hypothetical protein
MDTRIDVVLTTLIRAQRFLDANAQALGPINQTGSRKELDQAVSDLTGHVNTQESARKRSMGETSNQRVLRNTLLMQMRPIARIAASTLQSIPQFSSLRMPAGNPSAMATLLRARAMADAATPYLSTFTDAGLPADFLTQLSTASDAVQASLGTRDDLNGNRVVATKGATSSAQRGRRAIKVLDALIRRELVGNDELIAGWVSAKRYHLVAVMPAAAPAPAANGTDATASGGVTTLAPATATLAQSTAAA